jgi:hypothetical protein
MTILAAGTAEDLEIDWSMSAAAEAASPPPASQPPARTTIDTSANIRIDTSVSFVWVWDQSSERRHRSLAQSARQRPAATFDLPADGTEDCRRLVGGDFGRSPSHAQPGSARMVDMDHCESKAAALGIRLRRRPDCYLGRCMLPTDHPASNRGRLTTRPHRTTLRFRRGAGARCVSFATMSGRQQARPCPLRRRKRK